MFQAWILLAVSALIFNFLHLEMLKHIDVNKSTFHNKRFITNSTMTKAFTLGFDRVLADYWWLQFVQYYGDPKKAAEEKLRHAPSYLKLVIELDPHFIRPYWFASFVFAGDFNNQKEAAEILDYGIKNNPNEWSLPYIAGFNQALYSHNYKLAAKYYRMAAKIPGAPDWLERQATIMDSDIPAQVKVIKSWEQVFKDKNPMVKEKARATLQRLWSDVYWKAPTDPIRERALNKLKEFEVRLLNKNEI